MIAFNELRTAFAKGLREYLGIQIVNGNQTAEAPTMPYGTYNPTTIAAANNGTWQEHEDGVDRLLVRSIWSFSFLSADFDESMMYATKAREWFTHSGRIWLAEHGITVQTVTDITNRDNVLTVEYERKNGFDVVFYVYDEADRPADTYGYIETMEASHEITS